MEREFLTNNFEHYLIYLNAEQNRVKNAIDFVNKTGRHESMQLTQTIALFDPLEGYFTTERAALHFYLKRVFVEKSGIIVFVKDNKKAVFLAAYFTELGIPSTPICSDFNFRTVITAHELMKQNNNVIFISKKSTADFIGKLFLIFYIVYVTYNSTRSNIYMFIDFYFFRFS